MGRGGGGEESWSAPDDVRSLPTRPRGRHPRLAARQSGGRRKRGAGGGSSRGTGLGRGGGGEDSWSAPDDVRSLPTRPRNGASRNGTGRAATGSDGSGRGSGCRR